MRSSVVGVFLAVGMRMKNRLPNFEVVIAFDEAMFASFRFRAVWIVRGWLGFIVR